MKYKLLAIGTEQEVNIGDYIQALASSQFLPQVDGFVERENLKDYSGEVCKMIMNGWYIHNPQQWPPSLQIMPLFVAVHFNSTAKEQLLNNDSVQYLKKNEPIGCRDLYTQQLLVSKGVNAYFSGCMTLTLGYKYRVASNQRDGNIYFVDPYFVTHWGWKSICKNIVYLIVNYSAIDKIARKHPDSKMGLRKRMILTTFYREYKKFFSKDVLINAEYICQQSKSYKTDFSTNELRLKEAERLVMKYAKAGLVVTSRIHCALPCLGLETPVIYTEDLRQSEASACRLGGLRELFNILAWNDDHLEARFNIDGKISCCNHPPLKNDWKPLAQKLITVCQQFVR